jgi:hypothetical protein
MFPAFDKISNFAGVVKAKSHTPCYQLVAGFDIILTFWPVKINSSCQIYHNPKALEVKIPGWRRVANFILKSTPL